MDTANQKQQKRDMGYGIISILVLMFYFLLFGRNFIPSTNGVIKISGTYLFIQETFFWLSLLFIWGYSHKIEKQNLLIWQEKQYGIWMHIKSILAIFGMIFLLAIPTMLVLNCFHLVKESEKANQLRTILQANRPLLFYAALSAGVTEEFIFRGYLLPRFEIIFKNPYIAIIVSSVLFGLMHFGYGTIVNIVGPMIIGLVVGYFYWKYRNITIPIICHFLWDFISLSLKIKHH